MRDGGRLTPGSRLLLVLDLLAKVAIVVLLLVALGSPDLDNLKAKGAGIRLLVYPIGALSVPIWWWVRGRRHHPGRAYPWGADLLVTLPWLSDLVGNRLNYFTTISWWDKVSHFGHWTLLTAGVLLAWNPARRVGAGVVVMVGLGFGATAAILWELGEYAAFLRLLPTYRYVYPDTLGDLTLGTSGSLVAGLLVAAYRHRASGRLDGARADAP